MMPKRKYEYVIIRNDKEIGLNEYGFDYLINLEKVLDEIREYIITNTCWELRTSKVLQILDKVKE